ncbi:2-amino-4-hydroxy-6-hydroxymethyldihydropteridine diphosphokinase [Streptococcus dentapri]|uniref:2-amino-4-hydroxy-6-hydroxymethyldihydropteridine diphosphokinase n=1 Tax=Streptococcus dentapri TaxID=573564 RepID=A0ABV8CZ92_9STRE
MTVVYLSLGSNIGDRKGYLEAALAHLAELPQTVLVKSSSIYETPAWGVTEQADFLNLACQLETQLAPEELLIFCQQIEDKLGRIRQQHWGPRTLDIDILLYGSLIINTKQLSLPHPYMKERAFVLVPLLELTADLKDPQTNQLYADELARLDCSEIKLNS